MFYKESGHIDITNTLLMHKEPACKWVAMIAMLLLPFMGYAQTLYNDFSKAGITVNTHVYTVESYRAVLHANDNNRVTSTGTGSPNSSTNGKSYAQQNQSDPNYQFVFIQDPTTKNVYLYNVGQKRFMTSSVTLVPGPSDVTPIYVYSSSSVSNNSDYPLTFAFSNSITWSRRSGTANNPVMNINASSVVIDGYSSIDPGNQTTVTDLTQNNIVGSFDPTEALLQLRQYEAETFQQTNLKANTVYTLTTKSGATMYVKTTTDTNGNSTYTLEATKDTSSLSAADMQFVFIPDPTAGSSQVFLYNVGTNRYLNLASSQFKDGSEVTANVAAALHFFSTGVDSTFAITLSDSWYGGNRNFNFNGSSLSLNSTSSRSSDNQFTATAVTGTTSFSQAEAQRRLTIKSTSRSRITFNEAGIRLNSNKYVFQTHVRGGITANADGTQLQTATNVDPNDPNQQFVFITQEDSDSTRVYLYNVGAKRLVHNPSSNRGTMTLVESNDASPIYVYPTNSYDYNLAFSFNQSSLGTWGINISGGNLVVLSSYSTLDEGNRWRVYQADNTTISAEDLQTARNMLRGWLTGDFHYRGHSDRPLMKNGMGDVAEVHYYYYVNKDQGNDASVPSNSSIKPNNGIVLPLPFYNYYYDPDNNGMGGNDMEPNAYFRWYDYTVDGMPAEVETVGGSTYQRITPWTPSNVKKVYDRNGKDLGLFYYNIGNINPNCQNVGVIYNIPDEAANSDWKGDVIACDVSRYYDYNDSKTPNRSLFTHEPTLSVRYVFHILPAEKLADDMEASLIRAKSDSLTLQDHALLVFGAKDGNATMNMRTQFSRLKDYWFHPYTGNGNVYHKKADTKYNFNSTDFSNQLVRAKGTEWRVYNSDSTAYRVFATTSTGDNWTGRYGNRPSGNTKRLQDRDIDISLNRSINGSGDNPYDNGMYIHALNGPGWVELDGKTQASVDSIKINDQCFIVGYVTNGTNKCPFFNARLEINHLYPMSDDQIQASGLTERTPSYLAEQYGSPVATFSFDNENSSETMEVPEGVKAKNNFDPIPSIFAQRQYGFVYYDLKDWTANLGRSSYVDELTPLHGDYEIVKSMSMNDKTVYDHSYGSETSRYGYFFYTDASQESRQIGYQDFDGTLCDGSQIIISAYVASGNNNVTQSQPELRFSLYGLDKDADGNVISQKLFASICTGNFRYNINNYWDKTNSKFNAGTWYQVFGGVTLPSGVGIDNYTSFRVTIDNYCNDTNGADYAIDDIQIYQNNSKLTVIQIPALCRDEDPDKVDIKIKGNFNVMREVSRAVNNSAHVYYRFVRSDGSVVKGTNFYGTGHNDYGVATVPAEYDPNAKINGQNRFELNAAGQREVVLVYEGFNLSPDSVYFVSMNYNHPDNEGEWGKQNVICSMYSNNFQLVRQNIVVNNTENGNATVQVKCGNDTTTSYPAIRAGITAPDKINGGKIILNNIHFDWYKGSLAKYQAVKAEGNDSTLAGAVTHYRAAYPKGKYDPNNQPTTAPNGMKYSAEEKALIEAHLWSTTNTKGDLWMSGDSILQNAPLSAGRDTVLAIPIEDHITTNDSITYEICTDPMEIFIRGISDGPGLTFGMTDINYPSGEPYRSIRLGLPQIRKMGKDGELDIPIKSRQWQNETATGIDLRFVDADRNASVNVYLAGTNDPSLSGKTVKLAEVKSAELPSDDTVVRLCHIDTTKLHEGYYYELSFQFLRTDAGVGSSTTATQCIGETFLILKIVPEYLTWHPTVDNGMNANWNNDGNWTRSTAGELYNAGYTDYRTPTYNFRLYSDNDNYTLKLNVRVDTTLVGSTQPSSYVPMYFSKVIIPTETTLPYPMLGYIRRQEGTNLVVEMTNDKANAPTTNIEYDMVAAPDNSDSSNYICSVFDGNLCEQVYFKTSAQLRMEQYLKYEKAYAELALPINEWGTFTSPLDITFGGDMYVPKQNALQTTPLFQPINFEDIDRVDANGLPAENGQYGLFGKAGNTIYSRIKMPTYQKLWGTGGDEFNDTLSYYSSYDNPYMMLIYPSVENGDDIDLQANEWYTQQRNAWSHTFNALGNRSGDRDTEKYNKSAGRYQAGVGVAGKIGDDYATNAEWRQNHLLPGDTITYALIRLPKDDRTFSYRQLSNNGQETEGNEKSQNLEVPYRNDSYRLGIEYDPSEGSLAEHRVDWSGQEVSPMDMINPNDPRTNLKYVLVGNPYTSTISARAFVSANDTILMKVKRPVSENSTDSVEVNRLWTLYRGVLYEIDPTLDASVIAPGQAFFVKLKQPGQNDIVFTARMQTDPDISRFARASAVAALSEAKAYYVTDNEDIADVIEHGRITREFRCSSPAMGYIDIDAGSYTGSWAAQVYSVDGRMVTSSGMGSDNNRQVFTGSGMFIVRVMKAGGAAPETFKLVVK